MESKKVRIGNLIVTEVTDRAGNPVYDSDGKQKKRASLALGNKGKDPKYDTVVEIVVKDCTGKVIAKQQNGFINLVDPRVQPDDLLQAGIITEETAAKMKDQVKSMPDKIKFQMLIPRT